MERAYSVYGLRVLADAGIPGLLPADIIDRIDVRVWLNRMPPWWDARSATTDDVWYRSPEVNQRGQPRLTVWKVSGLPVRRVTPQADASCLPRLCEAILEDYHALSEAPDD